MFPKFGVILAAARPEGAFINQTANSALGVMMLSIGVELAF